MGVTVATKATDGKRVALYARVSTADQSTAMQTDALREYAQRRGLVVIESSSTRA